MIRFKGVFDKEVLNEKISKLEVIESNGVLITKYDGRFLKEKEISNRYESFDFKSYIKRVIAEISENFNIKTYEMLFKGGIQEIKLRSEDIVIDGENFTISFFILNSTDKSRALNVSLGLYSKKYTFITDAGSIYKKHYTGINEYVDDKLNLNTDIFKDLVEAIKSLKGEEILLRDVKKVITTSTVNDKYLSSQENAYANFLIGYYHMLPKESQLRNKIYNILYRRSDIDDFYLDSYTVFMVYLNQFSTKDSFVIKNESERILRMSKYFKRRNIMNLLNHEG